MRKTLLALSAFALSGPAIAETKVKPAESVLPGVLKPGIVNPMDAVSEWRPPVVPPLRPLFQRSADSDMTGVWKLFVGNSEQEAYNRSQQPAELYIKFISAGTNQFSGRYFHPSIRERSWPACSYAGDFMAETYTLPGNSTYKYPVMNMVQSADISCEKDSAMAFQSWNGVIYEAGIGGYTSRTIKGTVFSNNGNWLHILLVRDDMLSKL